MVSAFKIGHRKPSPTRCGGRSNTVECIDSGAADTARATFRAQPTIGSTVACWPFEKPLSLRGGHNAGPLSVDTRVADVNIRPGIHWSHGFQAHAVSPLLPNRVHSLGRPSTGAEPANPH